MEFKLADSTVRLVVVPLSVISMLVEPEPLTTVMSELNPADMVRCSFAIEVTAMLFVVALA